jgi:hypothetical protein
VAHWQVFDPPAWCGAASMFVCRGRGDLHSSWRSYLVESGINVTGGLGVSLGGLAFMASQEVLGRDLLAEKQYC